MESIEKNDIDISRLFNWGGKFTVRDSSGQEIIEAYVRIVGDSDLNRARVFALRDSARLRKALKTEGSDERLAYIPDNTFTQKENLIEAVLANSIRSLSTQAVKELNLALPKEPRTDASLEKHEDYQKLVDDYPAERQQRILEAIEKKINQERKRLEGYSKERLEQELEAYIIDNLCEEEMYKKFTDLCIYNGIYKDESYKERMFSSFEEFSNLPRGIKDQFAEFYATLDIRIEELKK